MVIHSDEQAAQLKQIERVKREAAIDEAIRLKAALSLYETKEGRKLLWWLLKIGHAIGENPYRANDRDTAFTCGEQNVGHQIMAFLIKCSPTAFADLMKEQDADARSRSLALAGPVASTEPGPDSEPDASASPEPRTYA